MENFDWSTLSKKQTVYSKEVREQMAAQFEATLKSINEHEVMDGTIVGISTKDIVVNIGFKSDGVVALSETRYNPDLKIGDKLEVYIESQEDKTGQLILSHKKARALRSWDRVNEALEKEEVIKGVYVVEYVTDQE